VPRRPSREPTVIGGGEATTKVPRLTPAGLDDEALGEAVDAVLQGYYEYKQLSCRLVRLQGELRDRASGEATRPTSSSSAPPNVPQPLGKCTAMAVGTACAFECR